jgi:acetoin utilization protein AcuB
VRADSLSLQVARLGLAWSLRIDLTGSRRSRQGKEAAMRVFEVMTEGVEVVAPTASASDAWELMRRKRVHHLIVKEGSKIVGVLSDRDAGSRSGAVVRAGRTVSDLMTRQVVQVNRNDTVRKVANLMRGRTIGCVAVVDGPKLIGIVTTSDLLALLGRGIDRRTPTSRATLHWRVPHRKQRRTGASW